MSVHYAGATCQCITWEPHACHSNWNGMRQYSKSQKSTIRPHSSMYHHVAITAAANVLVLQPIAQAYHPCQSGLCSQKDSDISKLQAIHACRQCSTLQPPHFAAACTATGQPAIYLSGNPSHSAGASVPLGLLLLVNGRVVHLQGGQPHHGIPRRNCHLAQPLRLNLRARVPPQMGRAGDLASQGLRTSLCTSPDPQTVVHTQRSCCGS